MITRIANELAVAFRTARCPDRQTLARQIATELAAAEERGRRAGIEEARKAIANEANGNLVLESALIPLPLAQRILAALEVWTGDREVDVGIPLDQLRALASELRAAVERKL